jgi:hypothetical protein
MAQACWQVAVSFSSLNDQHWLVLIIYHDIVFKFEVFSHVGLALLAI